MTRVPERRHLAAIIDVELESAPGTQPDGPLCRILTSPVSARGSPSNAELKSR